MRVLLPHTLIGSTGRPTELQLTVYVGTLFAMLMRIARYRPQQRVAA